jgi:hypothetical protein
MDDLKEPKDYTRADAERDSQILNCGEFLERYPDEEALAAAVYDDYEPSCLRG